MGAARFDIVVANLPHFAATEPSDPDRSPYWSMGGVDGRHLLDPFLAGLAMHLADDGVALITHNAFVGVDRTEAILMEQGLVSRGVLATTVPLHPSKDGALEGGGEGEIHRGRDEPAGTGTSSPMCRYSRSGGRSIRCVAMADGTWPGHDGQSA